MIRMDVHRYERRCGGRTQARGRLDGRADRKLHVGEARCGSLCSFLHLSLSSSLGLTDTQPWPILILQYIVCPDDQVTEELDRLRMAWSASDPVLGRPALSRWHPEWKASFDEYISQGLQAGRSRSPSRVRGRGLELAPGNGLREGSSRGVRTPAES